jgi:hypothetical protein
MLLVKLLDFRGCFLPSGRDWQLFGVQLAPGPEDMEK